MKIPVFRSTDLPTKITSETEAELPQVALYPFDSLAMDNVLRPVIETQALGKQTPLVGCPIQH